MAEEWRPIVGYEGFYSISNVGRVRRDKTTSRARAGHILRCCVSNDDYLQVGLCRPGCKPATFRVHRLVYAAFHGPIPPDRVVNHKNGDKLDASIDNLELMTVQENILHGYRALGRPPTGEKLEAAQVIRIRERRHAGSKLADIAIDFDVSLPTIAMIVHGKTWASVGGPIEPARPTRHRLPIDRYDATTIAGVVARVRAGERVTALADEFNVSRRCVYNWLRAA